MTETPTLAARLRSGSPVITGWSVLSAPIIPEIMARSGYEAVTIDLQHGMYDFAAALEALAATALGGAYRIARIPIGDNATAGRLADMGAECLIAPMINCREDASAFARAVKYPPVGDRSWSPFRAAMLNGQSLEDYRQSANERTISLAMIETQDAIDALDEILSVPELDGVFVGPSDLSLSLSNGAGVDPNGSATAKVCGEIAERAVKAGKLAGIFCMNADKVKEAIGQGFCLITLGIDRSFVGDAIDKTRREIEALTSG
ncbi:MAG: HpcH/HpaI aldolase/citrate lyase family protein [Roseibium sp.]